MCDNPKCVTDSREREESLREKEAFYRSLVENIALGISLIDDSHRIVMTNGSLARAFNKEPGEFVGKECFREFEKRAAVCPHCPGVAAMATGKPATCETRGILDDGSSVDVRIHAFPVFDEAGRATRFIEVAEDISERKKADEEIKSTLSLLGATLESTADGILVRDLRGNYVTYNRKFVEMWRLPESLLATKDDRQLRRFVLDQLNDPGRFLELTEHIYLDPAMETHDVITFKDGRVYERVSRPQIIGDEVVGTVISYRDITERTHLEAQLRQAQKLEAIGTLAGGIAHDFNNILTTVVGYASLLQMKLGGDCATRPMVDHILAAADRAANLTQSLLAYGRKQLYNPAPAELNTVIRGVEKFLRRLMPANIEFVNSLSADDLTVMADSGQLEQVLMNLITNAKDAMPAGGKLVIASGTADIGREYAEAHGYGKAGRHAFFSVADSGAGMDGQTLERIFEPFFTTKEVGKGTGLGLAMVYAIVKQHDGFVEVASTPGHGTRIKVLIPLIDAALPAGASTEKAALAGGSETILLIEDDADVRTLFRDLLELNGYTVIEAVDGVDGIEKYREHRHDVHLLVTDVMMPRKNGKETYNEIQKMDGNVPAIFMSGYSAVTADELFQEGVHYLAKPVRPQELLAKVRAALAGQAPEP